MTSLPSNITFEFLVELSMLYSKLEKLWEGIKPLPNLKWMNLYFSKNLKELPNLSTATKLHELNLYKCSSLVELPSSIGNATNLQKLDLRWCLSLMELPSSIGNATNLQKLDLGFCSSLMKLPSSIGIALINLEELDFSGCSSLVENPSSIGKAINLHKLKFCECSSLVQVPTIIGNLHKVSYLSMSGCSKLEALPVNINMKSLDKLDLSGCSSLKSFSNISTNIRYLNLSGTAIEEMPLFIRSFSRLETLDMSHCKNLLSLPQLPDSLSELDAENCESLEKLDCSFRNRDICLNFANCFKLNKEARDLIIQTSAMAILPGAEIPTYCTYRANGGSLKVKLNERPFLSILICKACILLACKNDVEDHYALGVSWRIRDKQNSRDVWCSPSSRTGLPTLTENLYFFEFKADVTMNELFFDFEISGNKWVIKECGIMENLKQTNK